MFRFPNNVTFMHSLWKSGCGVVQDDDVLYHTVKIISVTLVIWTLNHGFGFETKQPKFPKTYLCYVPL